MSDRASRLQRGPRLSLPAPEPLRRQLCAEEATAARRALDACTAVAAARPGGLGLGDEGPAVKNVKRHLAAAGFRGFVANGMFGARTAEAVRQYQASSGLPATGRVDLATWARLREQAGVKAVQRR